MPPHVNQTVVTLAEQTEISESQDSLNNLEMPTAQDSTATADTPADTLANDPHNREYYLAQIPFSDEMKAASDEIIKDGLFHAGIIFKDKLGNLPLSRKHLLRLINQYGEFPRWTKPGITFSCSIRCRVGVTWLTTV